MYYNRIKLTIISSKVNSYNLTPEDFFPFITKIIPKCNTINSVSDLSFNQILNKDHYFYFLNSDCKTIKEKIIALFLTVYGKNIRSFFCSHRKLIKKDLLLNISEYKFIIYGYHIYDIFMLNTKNLKKSSIFNFDGSFSRYFWFIENLKFHIKKQCNTSTKLFIVYNCYSKNFLKFIHNIYPNAIIVSRYHDMIIKNKHINFIKKQKNKLRYVYFESYSLCNAIDLKINYFPNSINIQELRNFQKNIQSTNNFDVYFLGACSNSDRFIFIKNLIITLCKQHIRFHIDAINFDKTKRNELFKELSNINGVNETNSIINTEPIEYSHYLKNLTNCKIIIDLYRVSPDEGLSFRTAEALALKKKIITNRDLNANNLYKFKENILSFDDINKINLKEFIDKPYVDPDPELLKQFDINEQIKNYLKN